MFCSLCNKLYYACTCGSEKNYYPPPLLTLIKDGSVIGSIDYFGVIRAPGQPFDNTKTDPFGNISGTDLQITACAMIMPK